jgi:hypothetical protein
MKGINEKKKKALMQKETKTKISHPELQHKLITSWWILFKKPK